MFSKHFVPPFAGQCVFCLIMLIDVVVVSDDWNIAVNRCVF